MSVCLCLLLSVGVCQYLSVFVCASICLCICLSMCVYLYPSVSICVNLCKCLYIYYLVSVCFYASVRQYLCYCLHVAMLMSVCVYINLCLCPCFLVAKQLYTWPCQFVCMFVCLFSVFDMKYLSLFEHQEYSKRERDFISKTENTQTTNKHTDVRNESYVLHLRRSVINWQRWLEVGTLVDNSITCLGRNGTHVFFLTYVFNIEY